MAHSQVKVLDPQEAGPGYGEGVRRDCARGSATLMPFEQRRYAWFARRGRLVGRSPGAKSVWREITHALRAIAKRLRDYTQRIMLARGGRGLRARLNSTKESDSLLGR